MALTGICVLNPKPQQGEESISDPFPHVPEAQLLGLEEYQEEYPEDDFEENFPPLS